jgi:hypothetical protein
VLFCGGRPNLCAEIEHVILRRQPLDWSCGDEGVCVIGE